MRSKLFLLLCFMAAAFTACLKDDYVGQNDIDQDIIQAYLAEKGLSLEYDPVSGIHYKIIKLGDTTHRPSVDSSAITVNYEGRLLNDTIFVKADSAELDMREQPVGFQLGATSIGEGGEIMMVIPSLLGYGSATVVSDTPYSVTLPPYSILVYDLELLKVGTDSL